MASRFSDALVAANEEERIIDAMILDVFYSLDTEADVDTIYEIVNFDADGSRLFDDSGEEAELITPQRIQKALARAGARVSGLLDDLRKFHGGLTDVAILESRTFLYREGTNYSLCTPHGNDMVNIQLSENEALDMAGDWIQHYDVGLGLVASA